MIELTFVAEGKAQVGCRAENGLTIGEQIRHLIGGLTLAYGEQIQMEFIDLDQVEKRNHPFVEETLHNGYQLPVLFVGNEPKYQGVIPIMALKSLLDSLGIMPKSYDNQSL